MIYDAQSRGCFLRKKHALEMRLLLPVFHVKQFRHQTALPRLGFALLLPNHAATLGFAPFVAAPLRLFFDLAITALVTLDFAAKRLLHCFT